MMQVTVILGLVLYKSKRIIRKESLKHKFEEN